MEADCIRFIDALIQRSPKIQIAYREIMDYWSPEEPPVTVLFATLGENLVEVFQENSDKDNKEIFTLIEDAMRCNSDQLVTAVATGLIEAIVSLSFKNELIWQQIFPLLGELSRKHAEAWIGDAGPG